MFGVAMDKFNIYPHHSDYLLLTHACGWSKQLDGGLNLKEIWKIVEDHCPECGKKEN